MSYICLLWTCTSPRDVSTAGVPYSDAWAKPHSASNRSRGAEKDDEEQELAVFLLLDGSQWRGHPSGAAEHGEPDYKLLIYNQHQLNSVRFPFSLKMQVRLCESAQSAQGESTQLVLLLEDWFDLEGDQRGTWCSRVRWESAALQSTSLALSG